jgi:hypothetical protein
VDAKVKPVSKGDVEVVKPQKPQIATAHWAHDRLFAITALPVGKALRIAVPRGMENRRIYAALHSSNSPGILLEAELVFYNGTPIMRLPFSFGAEGAVRVDGGLTNSSSVASVESNQIWWNTDGFEWPIAGFNVSIACDAIELVIQRDVQTAANLGLLLGCLSQGKEASE